MNTIMTAVSRTAPTTHLTCKARHRNSCTGAYLGDDADFRASCRLSVRIAAELLDGGNADTPITAIRAGGRTTRSSIGLPPRTAGTRAQARPAAVAERHGRGVSQAA